MKNVKVLSKHIIRGEKNAFPLRKTAPIYRFLLVSNVAGLWSINPQTLEDYKENGVGIIGELPPQYLKEKS